MKINHRHPIYTNEKNKLNELEKSFNIVYGAIIEKRNKGTTDDTKQVLAV